MYNQDGTLEDNQNITNTGAGAAAADKGAVADDNGNGHNVDVDGPLFQDRLVEESGILGGQEIYLEDVRLFPIILRVNKRALRWKSLWFIA